MRWTKAVPLTLGVLAATFGVGYLVAVQLLFPPLPEPENGIVVPDLAGTHLSQLASKLGALGLSVGGDTRIAHPSHPPGIVVAQDPLPGQQLRAGGVVKVGVSGGLPSVLVPNVIGFDVERATAVLSQLGLSADQASQQSDRPLGTVLQIQPKPGESQPVPARVLLIVSAGPPPEPPAPATPAAPPADSTVPPDTLALSSIN